MRCSYRVPKISYQAGVDERAPTNFQGQISDILRAGRDTQNSGQRWTVYLSRSGRTVTGEARDVHTMANNWPQLDHHIICSSAQRCLRSHRCTCRAPPNFTTIRPCDGRHYGGASSMWASYCPARGDAAAHEQTSAAWERRGRFRRWDAIRATTSLKSRNDQAEGTTH